MAPSTVVRKKPPPLMEMSSGLLVVSILPWVNCWARRATVTPMPGLLPLMPFSEFAYRSANCASELLKPTVLALAILLPMTSSDLVAPFRPLRPCWNMMYPCQKWDCNELRADGVGLQDLFDVVHAQLSERWYVELGAGGTGRHAGDRAESQRLGVRQGLAARRRRHGDGVVAVGRGTAVGQLAVPDQRLHARLDVVHFDGVHHLAAGILDLDGQLVRIRTRLDAEDALAFGHLHGLAGGQHAMVDHVDGLGRRGGGVVRLQRFQRVVELVDTRDRVQLGQLAGDLGVV